MRFDKFTLKVQEALQEAQSLASKFSHQAVDVEHLLAALIRQPEGIVSAALKKLGADTRLIQREVEKALNSLPKVSGGATQAYMTPRLNKVLESSSEEAKRLKDEFVSAEHVLIAMTEDKDGPAGKILRSGRRHQGQHIPGPGGHPGQPARHGPEPRGKIPGPREIRAGFQ